jgi:hypothetical protein
MPAARSALLIVPAVAVLACVAWLVLRHLRSDDEMRVVRNHFVDAETLAFERHATGEFPPLAGSRGHQVVIAKCFQGDDGLVIGWLERYPEDMKRRLDEARDAGALGPELLIGSSLALEVRRPESDAPWVAKSTPEGAAVCVAPKRKDGSDAIPAQPEP